MADKIDLKNRSFRFKLNSSYEAKLYSGLVPKVDYQYNLIIIIIIILIFLNFFKGKQIWELENYLQVI